MAGITDFRLRSAFLYLAGLVYRMATDAGHVIGLVRAGLPVQQVGVTLVTFQADAILGFQWRRPLATETDQADLLRILGVLAAWTMTGFTTLRREQRATIRFLTVLGPNDLVEMIFVTFLADINANVSAAGFHQAGENVRCS